MFRLMVSKAVGRECRKPGQAKSRQAEKGEVKPTGVIEVGTGRQAVKEVVIDQSAIAMMVI